MANEGVELVDGLGVLADRLGITLVEVSVARTVGTMPVAGNTQPYGLLHGGASCTLAETLGSIGAALHSIPTHGRYPVGMEINATHHKGVREGLVTGVATPIHLGRQTTAHEIVITNEAGDRICTARLTCFLTGAGRVTDSGAPD